MKRLPKLSPCPPCRVWLRAFLCVGLFLGPGLQAQPNANFILAFEAPTEVLGAPGETVQFEAVVRLVAAQPGVQGWSLSVSALNSQAAVIVDATTLGTVAAQVTDDPPGLRTSGFERTELSVTPPGGAISAVVLSFTQPVSVDPVTLPVDLLRFTVEATVPADGSQGTCTLAFVDGLQGVGQPHENRLTVSGAVVQPTVMERLVTISAGGGGFTLLDNTISYQGALHQNGAPLQGACDLQFSLWRHSMDADPSFRLGQPQTISDVSVQNGLFQVRLNEADEFGSNPFGRFQTWLEIAVREPAGSGAFSTLSPRQPVSPSPQSLHALTSRWSGLAGVPPGFADGIDNTGAGQWSELIGIPAGFADGLDDIGVDHWDGLSGIPTGFADKVDNDLLASLQCGDKFAVPSFNGAEWECRVLPATVADGNSLDASDGSPVNVVFVDNAGNVGVGTTTPSALLSVNGKANNATGEWSVFSDRRLKKNVEDLEAGSLDRLLRLRGVSFEYKDQNRGSSLEGARRGWIAQEVEEVFPEWVSESEAGMKMVTPSGFDALTVEALRELRAEKDAEIAALRQTVDELRAMVLEMKMGTEQRLPGDEGGSVAAVDRMPNAGAGSTRWRR